VDALNDGVLVLVRLAVLALLYIFLAAVLRGVWKDFATAAPARKGNIGRAFLVVVEGPDQILKPGQRIPIEGAASIGRESDNQVVIPDKTVSGRHAAIIYRDGRWWAEDFDSTNGTWVNDRRVSSPLPVAEGDMIQVGRFSFCLAV
jgi:pSer/pThr/pTyr-binding forkhead associated (FHA) protein